MWVEVGGLDWRLDEGLFYYVIRMRELGGREFDNGDFAFARFLILSHPSLEISYSWYSQARNKPRKSNADANKIENLPKRYIFKKKDIKYLRNRARK